MKKITFILLALISGTAFAQKEATAKVHAEIVQPIQIAAVTNTSLNFGSIDGGIGGGTVTITTEGEREASNKELLILTSEDKISAAAFNITAAKDYAYTVTIEGIDLVSGSNKMPVTFTQKVSNGTTGTGLAQTLDVGGTLQIAANQLEGNYSGDVKVTVDYN